MPDSVKNVVVEDGESTMGVLKRADRLRVLDMWRASGIFTFSVNQKEEDF